MCRRTGRCGGAFWGVIFFKGVSRFVLLLLDFGPV